MWDGIRNHKIEFEKASTPGEVKSYKLPPEELEKYRLNTVQTKTEKKPMNLHYRPIIKEMTEVQKKLTKEVYVKLNSEGKLDKEIMELYGMNHNVFYKLKKEWGLTGKPGRPVKENVIREKDVMKNNEVMQELKEMLKSKPIEITPVAPEVVDPIVTSVTVEDNKSNAEIERLQKLLAYQEQMIEELEVSNAALQKYKTLYFSTVEALKVHLP